MRKRVFSLLVAATAFPFLSNPVQALVLPSHEAKASVSAENAKPRKGEAVSASPRSGKEKAFTATLTTYWAQGSGSDYWTKKMIGATGERLKGGVTVAADPRVLPYGTIIDIAGIGRRVVQDTGSHVVNRMASRKRGVNYPVIDVFFENRSDALRFANKNEPFAQIRVLKMGNRS